MHPRTLFSFAATCLLASALTGCGTMMPPVEKQPLTGSWKYVLATVTRPDGTKFYPQGENSTGLLMLDGAGNFSWQVIRPDIPKIASNNRLTGTPDENKAVAQGILSYFGTYTVDQARNEITMTIASSSFANFNGQVQKRTIVLTGDELAIINPGGSTGGTAEVRWRRIR